MSLNNHLITFSTCWYNLKSKFDGKLYLQWIKHILSMVNNFNLVIYTNIETFSQMKSVINLSNRNIKIIIKPFEDFTTYKYKELWKKNHTTSKLKLHMFTDWKLNMVWNEKVFFVNETIKHNYFNTMYYGWCDIGYFRNTVSDLHTNYLSKWPNNEILYNRFNDNCIHYGCVQNNIFTYSSLQNDINKHYSNKLINQPTCQMEEICFAGGFFLLKKDLTDTYMKLYDEKLMYYFTNNFIIKDEKTIIMDLIFNNPTLFCSHTEDNSKYDNWFMFQRLFL